MATQHGNNLTSIKEKNRALALQLIATGQAVSRVELARKMLLTKTTLGNIVSELIAKGIVSDTQFTPFIVVNSPVSMRYDKVMGQIDMYPTLLNLLQLDDYYWTGLGESILNPNKKGFAVGSQMNVEGENYTPEEVDLAKEAYDISDEMIRFNYFGQQ